MSAIKSIIQLQPGAVTELFRAYGYDMPVTEKNLSNLVKVHGEQPLPFSSADGKQEKTTLIDVLDKIKGGLQTAGSLISVVKTGQIPVKQDLSQNSIATPRVFGINRTIFLMMAILTVIAIILILFRKK